jgi:hypothetical protein
MWRDILAAKVNNPAGRLLRVLTSLKAQGGSTRLSDAWRAILRIKIASSEDHNFEFFRRYGLLLALPARARAAILSVPDLDREMYLTWVPRLEAAFMGCGLNAQVSGFLASFDESSHQALAFGAELLSRVQAEKTVDQDELSKIAQQVEELRRDTTQSDIDEDLKIYVLEGLADIASAIEEYELEGMTSLERGLAVVLGSLEMKRAQSANWRESTIWKRIWRRDRWPVNGDLNG